MEWIPCKYLNQCFITELEDVPYAQFLVTYMTGKMKKRMVGMVWIERGRVIGKKYSLIVAYMQSPKPYTGGNDGSNNH